MSALVAYCRAREPAPCVASTVLTNAAVSAAVPRPMTPDVPDSSVRVNTDVTFDLSALVAFWSQSTDEIIAFLQYTERSCALARNIRCFSHAASAIKEMSCNQLLNEWFPRRVDSVYEAAEDACDWRTCDYRWFGNTHRAFEPRARCILTMLPERKHYLVYRVHLYGSHTSGTRAGCARRLQCLLIEHFDRNEGVAFVLPPNNEVTTIQLERRSTAPPDQWYRVRDGRKTLIAFEYLADEQEELTWRRVQ